MTDDAPSTSSTPSTPSTPSVPSTPSAPPSVPPSAGRDDDSIDWRAVARGAGAGLAVIVPVTVLHAVLEHEIRDFQHSAWRPPLFLLILAGYVVAGWIAARGTVLPLTQGTLAGSGALVLWIPVRIAIWAIREDQRGLFSGHDAVLKPGQLVSALLLAAAAGMLGGWLSGWIARRRDQAADRTGADHEAERVR